MRKYCRIIKMSVIQKQITLQKFTPIDLTKAARLTDYGPSFPTSSTRASISFPMRAQTSAQNLLGNNHSVGGEKKQSMRSTSIGFTVPSATPSCPSPPPKVAFMCSTGNMSYENGSKFRDSSLYNKNVQFQLQKDYYLQMREMQLRKKYEGMDPSLLKEYLPKGIVRADQVTSPYMIKPDPDPIPQENLLKYSYQEMFGTTRDSQKKPISYVNHSKEQFNLITHNDLRNSAHHDYHKIYSGKLLDYESFRPKKVLDTSTNWTQNPVAAKRMTDPMRRLEVQENRKLIQLHRRSYMLRNMEELRRKNKSVQEKKMGSMASSMGREGFRSSTSGFPSPNMSPKQKIQFRGPNDPIINSRRPFQVENFYKMIEGGYAEEDHEDSPTQFRNQQLHRRAITQLANYPQQEDLSTPAGGVGVQENNRITFKALRQLGQKGGGKQQQLDSFQNDDLSQILDSLTPTAQAIQKIKSGNPFLKMSQDHSAAMQSRQLKLSDILPKNNRQSLPAKHGSGMLDPSSSNNHNQGSIISDAAMSKRMKNFENFLKQRRNNKDREDAISHASQYLDNQSRASFDVKSKIKMKNLDLSQLKAPPQPTRSSINRSIDAIVEEENTAGHTTNRQMLTVRGNNAHHHHDEGGEEEQKELPLDDQLILSMDEDYLQKLNSTAIVTQRLMSSARRSPRYAGAYDDEDQEEQDNIKDLIQQTYRSIKQAAVPNIVPAPTQQTSSIIAHYDEDGKLLGSIKKEQTALKLKLKRKKSSKAKISR